MSIEQGIHLTGHIAWPVVALAALLVLRPYISQVTRAAADLRDVLNRSGEMASLVGQLAALTESTSDLKAMQEVALAGKAETPTAGGQANLDALWKQLEKEWQVTRDSFRTVAQSVNVPVSFFGTVGVRDAGRALVDKGVISEATASAITDLSAQYQYMWRTTTARSEYIPTQLAPALYRETRGMARFP